MFYKHHTNLKINGVKSFLKLHHKLWSYRSNYLHVYSCFTCFYPTCKKSSNLLHIVFYITWDLYWCCNLQRRKVYDALLRCMKPARIWDLYAFQSGPSKYCNTDPKVRLLNEYFRLLGKGSLHASMSMIEDGSFTLSNELWRITKINSNYTLCQSYPFALVVPKHIRYYFLIQDFPALTFCFFEIFRDKFVLSFRN